MRRIKFRAWDGEKMIYPPEGYMFEASIVASNYPAAGVTTNNFGRKDFRLMQYTGLKDKNRNDIYEGDIVQFRSTDSYEYDKAFDYENLGDTPIKAVMAWNEEACGFRAAIQSRFKIVKEMLEIVGNIHEHPHLLTVPATQGNG